MGSLKRPCRTSCRSSVGTIALNFLVFVFLRFGDRRTDEQMDSPDALRRSRYREQRLNNVADIKINVIPSSKIGFVSAITITVILSCWLLGKTVVQQPLLRYLHFGMAPPLKMLSMLLWTYVQSVMLLSPSKHYFAPVAQTISQQASVHVWSVSTYTVKLSTYYYNCKHFLTGL